MKLAYQNILINLSVPSRGCIVCFCALHVLNKSSTTMLHPPPHSLLYITLIAHCFKIFLDYSLIKPRTLQSIYKNLNCNLIPLSPVKHIYSCILDTNSLSKHFSRRWFIPIYLSTTTTNQPSFYSSYSWFLHILFSERPSLIFRFNMLFSLTKTVTLP